MYVCTCVAPRHILIIGTIKTRDHSVLRVEIKTVSEYSYSSTSWLQVWEKKGLHSFHFCAVLYGVTITSFEQTVQYTVLQDTALED